MLVECLCSAPVSSLPHPPSYPEWTAHFQAGLDLLSASNRPPWIRTAKSVKDALSAPPDLASRADLIEAIGSVAVGPQQFVCHVPPLGQPVPFVDHIQIRLVLGMLRG